MRYREMRLMEPFDLLPPPWRGRRPWLKTLFTRACRPDPHLLRRHDSRRRSLKRRRTLGWRCHGLWTTVERRARGTRWGLRYRIDVSAVWMPCIL